MRPSISSCSVHESGASEKGRRITQPQYKAKSMEFPWRVTGVSLHSKTEEGGVAWPQQKTAAKKGTTQGEPKRCAQACFPLFHFLYHLGLQPIEGCCPHSRWVLLSGFAEPYALCLQKHPQRHTQKCFTNFLGLSI